MATMNDDERYLIARRVLLDALDALGKPTEIARLFESLMGELLAATA